MSEERVDIVDNQDKPIGETITLDSAHKNFIPHRVSAVLVFKPSGKIIIQVHKHYGKRYDHSVGGHVSAGESYEVAARREAKEELRLTSPIKKVAEGVVSKEYYPRTGDKIPTYLVFLQPKFQKIGN